MSIDSLLQIANTQAENGQLQRSVVRAAKRASSVLIPNNTRPNLFDKRSTNCKHAWAIVVELEINLSGSNDLNDWTMIGHRMRQKWSGGFLLTIRHFITVS